MTTLGEVRAIAGQGLEGDRYLLKTGTYSPKPGPKVDRHLTLFETETLEALARDHNLEVRADQVRRNILTRGVPLNHLVGKTFRVGAVTVRGYRLCQPCAYLGELLDMPKIFPALMHRGGLNCEILASGTIRVGDTIQPNRT